MSLEARAVLIVEDEALIAMDLADTVAEAGGRVVGPAATVAEALALLDATSVDAAICDAMLADRDVTPLALALLARGVPLVVHSATGLPRDLAAVHANVPVIPKPARATQVVDTLAMLVKTATT